MKIPKQIRIGGHKVKIDISKELTNLDGRWDSSTNTIHICKSLPQSQKEVTLIHEMFHAMNCTWSGSPHGHDLAESLAQQIYQVFSDNRMLK